MSAFFCPANLFPAIPTLEQNPVIIQLLMAQGIDPGGEWASVLLEATSNDAQIKDQRDHQGAHGWGGAGHSLGFCCNGAAEEPLPPDIGGWSQKSLPGSLPPFQQLK